ncbi:hypothetical protein Poli38472_009179 [Pythium oligandrum]|uniref:Uncharacterized protein n=1 Tax=Pythium oligandrum TaxID=41045 RepID=A0A8K1FMM1_PYTOL|nr:hypothetical protein Poli38472_009179 [Pythium oligandrum]|eukprot:TMW65012.1 hypothetical protein Poli38472_009179 [Pythium oligandrum]
MSRRDVLEAGVDGVFDLDAMSERVMEIDVQASETLREKGNVAFQNKSYEMARSYYTQAIAKNPQNHLLYGNRSASSCHLKDYDRALEDAEEAITLAPKWVKGYLRKATACEGLKRWNDAMEAYKQIIVLSASDSAAETKKANTRIAQIETLVSKGAVQKGFFETSSAKAKSSIYAEKEDIVMPVVDTATGQTRLEDGDERRWRYMLKRLKDGCNKHGVNGKGERVVLDDGVFAKLRNEHDFQALIFPGIPKEQLVHAPKNILELLEDPWYEQELLSLMPKVQQKADSVLTNVKKRGAAQGDIMDAATEQMLRPQVLQEAFAREVLSMVHRINYKKHMLLATDERMMADPNAEEATWDQLSEPFLDDLLSKTPPDGSAVAGAAVLDEFMGQEWTDLLRNDVQRMHKNGLLMPTTNIHAGASTLSTETTSTSTSKIGQMRFVEKTDCEKEYPALAELLEKLHALPFEINKKRSERAQLCAQFAHCSAVHHLQAGEAQPLRLDCGVGEKDNGFKLTCVYFFSPLDKDTSLCLRTNLDVDGPVQRVQPQADRLVIFQSQRVLNEIQALADGQELFYLTFWIHGRELK